MTIPERLYRIARHKLTELKDRLDQLDSEAEIDPEIEERRRQSRSRADARRELDEDIQLPNAPKAPGPDVAPVPLQPNTVRRTPEEIARGVRPGISSTSTPASAAQTAQPDPLAYHYKLLGVESGSDFATVQAAYNNLAARCDVSRFPAGSLEAQQAEQIRQRLDASYKALRDALDMTARRFDLLEFDSPPPPNPDTGSGGNPTSR